MEPGRIVAWQSRGRVFWGAAAALSLLLVAALDLATGSGYSFTLFYLVPIGLAAFGLAPGWVYLVVTLATGLWFGASLAGGRPFHGIETILWTVLTRLLTNGLFALAVLKLREAFALLKEKVASLERANEEKVLLLKELNHRVKNSLATVVSLIRLEEELCPGPEGEAARSRLEGRVRSMGELYNQLVLSSSIAEVELSPYLRRLVENLAEGMGAAARGIRVEAEIEELRVDSKRALSLGLIVNELLTDSLKYGFPEGREGRAGVALRRAGERLILEIADDGVGLPPGFQPGKTTGLGLRLVQALVRELRGELCLGPGPGASFRLDLPESLPE